MERKRWMMKAAQKKYNTPLKEYISKNLEDILKLVCFLFHPDCTEKIVKSRTKYFTGSFVLTDLIRFRKYRKLIGEEWLPSLENREYAAEDPEINFISSFSFEEIPKMLAKFKQHSYRFFRNREDTAFVN